MFTEMDCVPVNIDRLMQRRAEAYVQRKLQHVRDTVERRVPAERGEDLILGHLAKEAVKKYLTVSLGQQGVEDYDDVREDEFQYDAPWELRFGRLTIDIRSSIETTIHNNILHRIVLERHHILPAIPTIMIRGQGVNFRDHLRDRWTLESIPSITPHEMDVYINGHTFLKDCVVRVYFVEGYGRDICFLVGWVEGRILVKEGRIGILRGYPGLYHILPIRQGMAMVEFQRYIRDHQ